MSFKRTSHLRPSSNMYVYVYIYKQIDYVYKAGQMLIEQKRIFTYYHCFSYSTLHHSPKSPLFLATTPEYVALTSPKSFPTMRLNPQASSKLILVRVGHVFLVARSQPRKAAHCFTLAMKKSEPGSAQELRLWARDIFLVV